MRGSGDVHARTHVRFCFVYHVLEIGHRFLPLVMLLVLIRWWFILVLAYLWIARGVVVQWSDRKAVRAFRFRVRFVAMPFLDSILDGAAAFKAGFVLTLVKSIVFMASFLKFSHDDLSDSLRLMLVVVSAGCMLGKMFLAWVAIPLLKEKDSDGAAVEDERGGEAADSDMTGVEDGTANGEVKEASTLSELGPKEGTNVPPATNGRSAGSVSGEAKGEENENDS
ncbi:unnamed protein product [Ectocarpus sp. CCAP 1310/34]|nr:unnamed protein product [Ectocarpus sp. CCAP 1310/34]